MTQITDYASLQAAAIEYLAKDGDTTFAGRVPTFIQFCEAKLNRMLFTRQMEQRSTTTVNINSTEPEFISLPSDFQSMRRIRVSSVNGKPSLEFKTGVQMDEYRFMNGDVSAQPLFFTIFGTEIELAPTPDAAYTLEMVYRKNIPDLADNNTNWLLTLAPDLYLYGTLLETAPYTRKDDRLTMWADMFAQTLDSLNTLGRSSTFNAGPLAMRPTGVTP